MNLTEKTKKRIRLACDIILPVLIAATGIAFAVSCYVIYRSGEAPFTAESTAGAFWRISPLVFVTLAAIIAAYVVSRLIPTEDARLTGSRTVSAINGRLADRVDICALSPELAFNIRKERKYRKNIRLVHTVFSFLGCLLPLIVLLDPDSFPAVHGNINKEIMNGMVFCIFCLLPVMWDYVIYTILRNSSLECENKLLKEAIRQGSVAKNEGNAVSSDRASRLRSFFSDNEGELVLGLRIALVGCAVLFIILGIVNGGMQDVLIKAVNICTECIGLG